MFSKLEVFDPQRQQFFHVMQHDKPLSCFSSSPFAAETEDGVVWVVDNDHIWKIDLSESILEDAVATGNANIQPLCKRIALQRADSTAGSALAATLLFKSQKQHLLIGTSQGLFRFDPVAEKAFPELEISDFFVLSAAAESKTGDIVMKGVKTSMPDRWAWISESGVREYNKSPAQYASGGLFALDGEGYLWTSRNQSIQKWQIQAFFDQKKPELELKADALAINGNTADCTKFLIDKSGIVWVGTNGFGIDGLIKATPNAGGYQFKYYNTNPADRSSLSDNLVLCVADDPLEPQRYRWVGTKGGGLNRFDKQSGTCKHNKKEHGLPNDVVYGILPENVKPGTEAGYIWLGTNQGLCRFNVRTEKTKNFTVADGYHILIIEDNPDTCSKRGGNCSGNTSKTCWRLNFLRQLNRTLKTASSKKCGRSLKPTTSRKISASRSSAKKSV